MQLQSGGVLHKTVIFLQQLSGLPAQPVFSNQSLTRFLLTVRSNFYPYPVSDSSFIDLLKHQASGLSILHAPFNLLNLLRHHFHFTDLKRPRLREFKKCAKVTIPGGNVGFDPTSQYPSQSLLLSFQSPTFLYFLLLATYLRVLGRASESQGWKSCPTSSWY